MDGNYDVAIIGGGAIGSSIARELSRFRVRICVLEKEADVCCGNSGRNTGMLHAGFHYEPGSAKAKFSVEGNRLFDGIAEELDVPFRRTGKLTVGFTERDMKYLLQLKERGETNGVPGLAIIDSAEIKKIDPNVSGEFALYSPSSGIFCPYLYTIALAENACSNGVDYYFEHEVLSVTGKPDGNFDISTTKRKFCAKWIINSAGLDAPPIAEMLGSTGHVYKRIKGEYILLDKRAGVFLSLPVYPTPGDDGVTDVHVTPTIDGNVLVGPTCDEVVQTSDFDTTYAAMATLVRGGARLFEKLKPDWYIRTFAGIFPRRVDPKTGEELDFLIEHRAEAPSVLHLIGINSPGLTSAYPIARHVAGIVAGRERLTANEDFNPRRKGILKFSEQDVDTQTRLIKENPDYGEIVCRCECVTRAEILEAIANPLHRHSVSSIKFRTRATMGRCQGGYCETRITAMLQEKLGIRETDVRLGNSKSYMFTGKVREHETD